MKKNRSRIPAAVVTDLDTEKSPSSMVSSSHQPSDEDGSSGSENKLKKSALPVKAKLKKPVPSKWPAPAKSIAKRTAQSPAKKRKKTAPKTSTDAGSSDESIAASAPVRVRAPGRAGARSRVPAPSPAHAPSPAPAARKKQEKLFMPTRNEQDVAFWYRDNAIFYDRTLKEYKDTARMKWLPNSLFPEVDFN